MRLCQLCTVVPLGLAVWGDTPSRRWRRGKTQAHLADRPPKRGTPRERGTRPRGRRRNSALRELERRWHNPPAPKGRRNPEAPLSGEGTRPEHDLRPASKVVLWLTSSEGRPPRKESAGAQWQDTAAGRPCPHMRKHGGGAAMARVRRAAMPTHAQAPARAHPKSRPLARAVCVPPCGCTQALPRAGPP